jgi:sulfoxide reductase heme-binding subunit YedZ
VTGQETFAWVVARASGIILLLLLWAAAALGLLLSGRPSTRTWPRGFLVEGHRELAAFGAAALAVHLLVILTDPFQRFQWFELVIPGLSHYRPLYVGAGVLAGELLLVVGLTSLGRRTFRERWWRWTHRLALPAFALAWVHAVGTGTDSLKPWMIGLTVLTGGSIVALGGWRMTRSLRGLARDVSPVWAVLPGALAIAWAIAGPWRPGWNIVANNGAGSGARLAAGPGPYWPRHFADSAQGSLDIRGAGDAAAVSAALIGSGELPLRIEIDGSGAVSSDGYLEVGQTSVDILDERGSIACSGDVTRIDQFGMDATCTGRGATVRLTAAWGLSGDSLSGTLTGDAGAP